MDTLSFIASLAASVLSWPVATFVVALTFRKPIIALLTEVRKLKAGIVEFDFGKGIERLKDELANVPTPNNEAVQDAPSVTKPAIRSDRELLEELTDLMPSAAVLASWRNVEKSLELYLDRKGIKRPLSGQGVLRHLDYDPNFPPKLVSAYQELRLLRNNAAHARQEVSSEQAKEFVLLAEKLAGALYVASEAVQ